MVANTWLKTYFTDLSVLVDSKAVADYYLGLAKKYTVTEPAVPVPAFRAPRQKLSPKLEQLPAADVNEAREAHHRLMESKAKTPLTMVEMAFVDAIVANPAAVPAKRGRVSKWEELSKHPEGLSATLTLSDLRVWWRWRFPDEPFPTRRTAPGVNPGQHYTEWVKEMKEKVNA